MSKMSAVARKFCSRRAVAGVLAVLASAGALGAVQAGSASAAIQWEDPITFECYGDAIKIDPVSDSLAEGQGTVAWGAELYIYNGRTRRWQLYYVSQAQSYDSDMMFGDLADSPINVTVAANRYYMAYDTIGNSTTPQHWYRDHAEVGGTSEFVCHTS